MSVVAIYNLERATFSAFAAKLQDPAEETTIGYVNPMCRERLGTVLIGRTVVEVLEEFLGSTAAGHHAFSRLVSEGALVLDGVFKNLHFQLHMLLDVGTHHLQAALMDVTETREAMEGFEYTAGALARASEVNDEDTGEHILRINRYSARLAELMGLDVSVVKQLEFLAQLHDVGKIHIPPHVIKKQGRLTEEEFTIIKEHTIYGAKIIGEHPRLRLARDIALAHHERYDGTGYPNRLAGESIPICARIVSVVDVFDALVSKRPYKKSFSYEEAFTILAEGDGRTKPEHFDPRVLRTFIKHYGEFKDIHTGMSDPDGA